MCEIARRHISEEVTLTETFIDLCYFSYFLGEYHIVYNQTPSDNSTNRLLYLVSFMLFWLIKTIHYLPCFFAPVCLSPVILVNIFSKEKS